MILINKLNRRKKIIFKKYFINFLEILIGSAIMAAATSFFLLPNQLSSGGFSGISTILYYFLKFPMGLTIIVLNIPLYIVAFFKIGRKFISKAILGTVSFSVFIEIFDKFTPLTEDRFLACIYGGIVMGLGTAIILKSKSSTGGTDLISYIAQEYNVKIRLGRLIVIIDTVIVVLNMIFFKEVEIGLYSAITIYLMGQVIDIVFEGITFTKLIFIISSKNRKIAEEIGKQIKKGTTGLYGEGMYTKDNTLVLMCAASKGDVIKVKETAQRIDPQSFIIISNAREVFGKGFKRK